RHARKLPHGRPGKRALAERGVQLGEALEGERRPELVVGRSATIAKQFFDVLRERGVPEVSVHLGAKGTEQRQALAPIELGALLREPLERFMCQDPVHGPKAPNALEHEASIHPCFASPLAPRRRVFRARIGARAISVSKTRERATQRPAEHNRQPARASPSPCLPKAVKKNPLEP